MATHLEDQFDSFRKLCAAVEHYQRRQFEDWVFSPEESVNIEVYYPVLVFQGEIIEVRPSKGTFKTANTYHVRFHQSLWTRTEEEDYSIDVITEKHFPKLLRLVEREAVTMARLLRRRHKEVRAAVERIASKGRRLRSPLKIRKLLEF